MYAMPCFSPFSFRVHVSFPNLVENYFIIGFLFHGSTGLLKYCLFLVSDASVVLQRIEFKLCFSIIMVIIILSSTIPLRKYFKLLLLLFINPSILLQILLNIVYKKGEANWNSLSLNTKNRSLYSLL